MKRGQLISLGIAALCGVGALVVMKKVTTKDEVKGKRVWHPTSRQGHARFT